MEDIPSVVLIVVDSRHHSTEEGYLSYDCNPTVKVRFDSCFPVVEHSDHDVGIVQVFQTAHLRHTKSWIYCVYVVASKGMQRRITWLLSRYFARPNPFHHDHVGTVQDRIQDHSRMQW